MGRGRAKIKPRRSGAARFDEEAIQPTLVRSDCFPGLEMFDWTPLQTCVSSTSGTFKVTGEFIGKRRTDFR